LVSRLREHESYENRQLEELKQKLESAQNLIKEEQKSLNGFKKQEKELGQEEEKHQGEKNAIKADLEAGRKKAHDIAIELKEIKAKYDEILAELGSKKKEAAHIESQIEKNLSERHSIFKRCRMEEIDLPLTKGSLENVKIVESEGTQDNMEVDTFDTQEARQIYEAENDIEVDYSDLEAEHKKSKDKKIEEQFNEQIRRIIMETERLAPNLRSVDKLEEVENRLKATSDEFEVARKHLKTVKDKFVVKRQERFDLFMEAFNHISGAIEGIYKELTTTATYPHGGQAYLTLEDTEEPFEAGIKYHAMPPSKRIRDMEQLSGGEQTIAALALLFAIHSFRPAPFFVLDEVDSALDNANVNQVANYIKAKASENFQVLQISHKAKLYEKAEALVGIYLDNDEGSSKVLTLKLTDYPV